MRLGELIEALQQMRVMHGDMDVYVVGDDYMPTAPNPEIMLPVSGVKAVYL